MHLATPVDEVVSLRREVEHLQQQLVVAHNMAMDFKRLYGLAERERQRLLTRLTPQAQRTAQRRLEDQHALLPGRFAGLLPELEDPADACEVED